MGGETGVRQTGGGRIVAGMTDGRNNPWLMSSQMIRMGGVGVIMRRFDALPRLESLCLSRL
jgi:hypothetical protein